MSQLKIVLLKIMYKFFSLFPIQEKIVGSSFYGLKYENNPRFVFEKLQEKYPNIRKYWIVDGGAVELPAYVTPIKGKIRKIYEYATSKVIIDSHFLPMYYTRRKGQLVIFMYHGGIGIKRNSNEVPGREKSETPRHNARNVSFMISNSTFTTNVNRTSLEFTGPILKCGYPKDDPLFEEQDEYKKRVCDYYGVTNETRFFMYAPTYRQDMNDLSGFDIDLVEACKALSAKYGGPWRAIVKWHPKQNISNEKTKQMYGNDVIDVTDYSNMQELIIASDAFVSDYSSCIFEAAERKIPCFSYANDWDVFKKEQGVHFEIDKLPFPYCRNNEELLKAIRDFDQAKYLRELEAFLLQEGLDETGDASETLADIINQFIQGDEEVVTKLRFEEA